MVARYEGMFAWRSFSAVCSSLALASHFLKNEARAGTVLAWFSVFIFFIASLKSLPIRFKRFFGCPTLSAWHMNSTGSLGIPIFKISKKWSPSLRSLCTIVCSYLSTNTWPKNPDWKLFSRIQTQVFLFSVFWFAMKTNVFCLYLYQAALADANWLENWIHAQ